MPDSFRSARIKFYRANEHLRCLGNELDGYFERTVVTPRSEPAKTVRCMSGYFVFPRIRHIFDGALSLRIPFKTTGQPLTIRFMVWR